MTTKTLTTALKKRLRQFQKQRQDRKLQQQLAQGEQDVLDMISYEALVEKPDHLVIDEMFVRTLYISGYPHHAQTGWLSMLINFNHNVDISYHLEPLDPVAAIPKLRRKITELESKRRMMLQKGQIVGSEITDPLEGAITLQTDILRGEEKLFQVSLDILILADSLSELNKITKQLESVIGSKLFQTKTARFEQLKGLQSILPRAENVLGEKRNLDTSSASLTFPFTSSELSQETGILYGINKSNNSLVMIDRFSLHNANSITFAQSGSGKSYASKVEILRQLMQGTKVIVIDPEREYKRLCESVKGSYIKLGINSREKINPFDFSLTPSGNHTLAEHIQNLTDLISLMVEDVTPDERATLDKALIETYKAKGWSLREKKQGTEYPLLSDFYTVLSKMDQPELCTRLEKYTTGSLSSVFESQTTLNLDNRLVVFDIKDLPESLRKIMLFVVANFVYTKVKNDPQKRLLVIDEGWLLLEHEESARFVAGLTRRARKYYLGVNIISQQANDFLGSEYGRALASQASLRILMKQDTTTIKGVVQAFKLSEYEEKFLLTCDRGEALLLADHNHVALRVIASDKEHPLISTTPSEGYQAE